RVPLTASYRAALLDGISEWKRAGLTTELFNIWAAEKGEKEQQLALAFFTYQHLLNQKGFVEEDRLLEELREIRANSAPVTERSQVLLYGYADLTPLQADYINSLSLWFEFEAVVDPTGVAEFESFIRQHFHWKSSWENTTFSRQNHILSQLQQVFWNREPEGLTPVESDASLQLLQADGWTRQAAAIAREVCAMLRGEPELELKDFLILTPQPQAFIKKSWHIFADYRISLAAPPRSAKEFKGVIQFLQALQTVAKGWQWPDLEALIRQFYAGVDSRDRDLLLLSLGKQYGALSGKERWVELLVESRFQATLDELGIDLEPLEECIHFLRAIPENGTWEEYLNLARDWFEAAANQTLAGLAEDPALLRNQLLNYEAVSQLKQACLESLQNLELLTAMSGTTTPDEFRRFVEDYLLKGEVEHKEAFQAEIRVLPPREARGLRAKVVFITGLEQGVFPRNYINDWKLNPQDRFELKTLGVELETGETYQLQEKMAFYWALQTASERLYLVTQLQDDTGQLLNPSAFLTEVYQWVPGLTCHAKYYPLEPRVPGGFGDCFSRLEQQQLWVYYLTRPAVQLPAAEAQTCDYLFQDPGFRELAVKTYQWRFRRHLVPKQPFYTNPGAAAILERLGAQRPLAITALEEYRSCPYRFFLKQVLRLKPVLDPQLLPEQIDFGNLYHQILREFGEHYRGQTLDPSCREEYLAFLEESFERNFTKWRDEAANDLVAAVLTIQQRQIRQTLKRWLDAELEWAETTGYRYTPRFLEYSFGMPSGSGDPASLPQPFVLTTPECSVRLMGRVDRVDSDPDGHFIIYDYKLGRGYSTGSIVELKNLQMPVYLQAMEQLSFGPKTAVGGSYLSLKEPSRLSGGIWRQTKIGLDSKNKGLLNEIQWDEWQAEVTQEVTAAVNGIRAGYFFLTGEKCPDYCEFKKACRRQEREEEQNDGISAQ
ncbi:MAG TPA: PD-(D/E)XK nuclease family protein, partial [Bacillota bacterium]|nr:PD-(D/E)XK nuclease family protein [Bacillota bacterium]